MQNTCKLDTVLTRIVNNLTTNELVKVTMLWTTGPRTPFQRCNNGPSDPKGNENVICTRKHILVLFNTYCTFGNLNTIIVSNWLLLMCTLEGVSRLQTSLLRNIVRRETGMVKMSIKKVIKIIIFCFYFIKLFRKPDFDGSFDLSNTLYYTQFVE